MNENPAFKNVVPPIRTPSIANGTGNQNPNPKSNGKFSKFLKTYWKLLILLLMTIGLICAAVIYKVTFENNLVVENQILDPVLDIKRLALKRGGFLIIDSMK